MDVKDRIRISRIIEKMNEQEVYSKKLGIENKSIYHGKLVKGGLIGMGFVRKTRRDCTVGTFEKKHGLPAGTIRNQDGRDTRSETNWIDS